MWTAVVVLLSWASLGLAQTADDAGAGGGTSFMPRYAFHLTAEHLSNPDPRFVWDTNFGGDLDVVRVGRSRLTFVANYQAMLGEQFRAFDPNQGNYILEGSIGTTIGSFEVGPVFYHQSRHLSDRPKRDPVDWNMLGGRVRHRWRRGAGSLETRADLRRAVQRTFVDYTWELDAGVRGQFVLHPRVSLVGGGGVRRMAVNGTIPRGTQTGGRVDGGIRFQGDGGALELFLAFERRIDPYQLQFGTDKWASVGMRLLSR